MQRTSTYGRDLISQNQVVGSTWTPSYDMVDGLGSVRTLADASGSTSNRYGFTGEPFDASLGLYYLHARYYTTSSGRFWSRDTAAIDPQPRASRTAMPMSRAIRSMRPIWWADACHT